MSWGPNSPEFRTLENLANIVGTEFRTLGNLANIVGTELRSQEPRSKIDIAGTQFRMLESLTNIVGTTSACSKTSQIWWEWKSARMKTAHVTVVGIELRHCAPKTQTLNKTIQETMRRNDQKPKESAKANASTQVQRFGH